MNPVLINGSSFVLLLIVIRGRGEKFAIVNLPFS